MWQSGLQSRVRDGDPKVWKDGTGTDRQTNGQTETDRQRQTEAETDRQIETDRQRQTDERETDRQTD